MPRVKKFRSDRLVLVKTGPYRVKWDGECRSKFQANVKKWLEPYWHNHLCVEEWPIPGTRLRIDLVNLTLKVIVETSGAQHVKFTPYFHTDNRFNWHGQIKRDEHKREWAEANGFKFVEIYDEDMPLTKQFFKEKYDIDL